MWCGSCCTVLLFSLYPHTQTFPLSANPSPLVLQPRGTPKQSPPAPSSARRRKVARLDRSQSTEDSTLTGGWGMVGRGQRNVSAHLLVLSGADVSSLSCASGSGSLVDYYGNHRMAAGPSWDQVCVHHQLHSAPLTPHPHHPPPCTPHTTPSTPIPCTPHTTPSPPIPCTPHTTPSTPIPCTPHTTSSPPIPCTPHTTPSTPIPCIPHTTPSPPTPCTPHTTPSPPTPLHPSHHTLTPCTLTPHPHHPPPAPSHHTSQEPENRPPTYQMKSCE